MAEPYRVIVVEDDPDVALYSKTVLERGGCVVMTLGDGREAAAFVQDFEPDVLVTDIELPGMSGLDLIAQVRDVRDTLPIIVMTAHASVDYAITALRNQADEFLTKPVTAAALLGHVNRLAAAGRLAAASAPQRQVVLAIGAHPDDVEVGVGGILAAHRAAGDPVTILTLSKGMRDGGIHAAWTEGSAAAGVIGATLRLEEEVDDPTEVIRRVIAEVAPTIVYVHSRNDDNHDHRTVHEATLVAASKVRTLACYQGTGATVDFRPNRFIPIDGHTDTKLAMLACFAEEATERPAYLRPDFALATARAWSRYGTSEYTEPLEIVRDSAVVA
jgi:CheY-like chemotaxis protein/LmbE family N-acetylglucosaminyl deacetylase